MPAPTGTTTAAGAAPPSCSQSSNATVLVPARKASEEPWRRWKPELATACCRAAAAAAARPPGIGTTVAPYACAWASLAGDVSAGTNSSSARPARAQYAASEAPALPEESAIADVTPASSAQLTATAEPRSLNDPVGIRLSSL